MAFTPSDPNDPSSQVDGGFEELNPENVEAVFQRLHSLEDNGAPIEIPEQEPDEVEPQTTPTVESEAQPTTPSVTSPPSSPSSTPSQAEDVIEVDGVKYPTALLREFISFDNFLKLNPAAAERMRSAFQEPQAFTSPQPQYAPPPPIQDFTPSVPTVLPSNEELDLEDPTTRYLVANLEQVRQQNAQFQAYLQQQQEQSNLQQLQSGVDTFTSAHSSELSPDEIIRVRQVAAANNYLDGFMRAGHPIGQATVMALDTAMWTIPEIRAKLSEGQQLAAIQAEQQSETQARADAARQRRLSALSNGNGNTSRTPAPTQESPRLGLLRGIREALTENQSQAQ